MADTTQATDSRQDHRYEVSQGKTIEARVERLDGSEPATIDGQLIDLSRRGAKVFADTCLKFAEPVHIHIASPELKLSMDLAADVCWSRPSDENRWLLGFSITPAISDDILSQLAASEFIERRRSARYDADLEATVSWELGDEAIPAQLRDYSTNGFCIVCRESGELGQRLLLDLHTADGSGVPVSGKISWRRRVGESYLVGCTFNALSDFKGLREVAASADTYSDEDTDPVNPRRSTPRLTTRVAFLICAVAAGVSAWTALEQRSDDIASHPVPTRKTSHSESRREAVAQRQSPASEPDGSSPTQSAAPPSVAPVEPAGHEGPDPTQPQTFSTEDARLPDQVTTVPETAPDQASSATSLLPDLPDIISAVLAARTQHAEATVPETSVELVAQTEPEPDVEAEATPSSETPKQLTAGLEGDLSESVEPVHGSTHTNDESVEPEENTLNGPPAKPKTPASVPRGAPQPSGAEQEHVEVPDLRDNIEDPVQLKKALAAATQGEHLYRSGRHREAIEAFETATHSDATNPLFHYLLALALYQADQVTEAHRAIQVATQLERSRPVTNWGRRLSRYQGRPRLWLEQQRSRGLTAP